MEHRLNELKTEFSGIIELKEENANIFMVLDDKIIKLKNSYNEFIKNNKNNLFVFGLDSFHFQGKLIDIEYDDIKRLFNAITNRMYCEYYKLHKIILDYVIENVTDKKILELVKINNNFPIYKDLEPFKQYDFVVIQQIHELNISILHSLCSFLISKEHDLKNYQNKNKTGLNIDNFVSTFNFNNTVMKEKVTLFITYIEFFHKLHTKYLKRFTTKIQLLISQLNYDIKFEDNEKPEVAKKNALNTLKNEITDKKLLKSLKSNMSDNDDMSVSSEIYNKINEKTSSDESLTNSSDRSGSDASDKPYVFDSNFENNENSSKIFLNIIDQTQIENTNITSPKVQFNNVDSKKPKSSSKKTLNNQNNTENKLQPKGIIKMPSKESVDLSLDNITSDEFIATFEKQSPNDELMSILTTDSNDEIVQDPKFKLTKYKENNVNNINELYDYKEPENIDETGIVTINFQENQKPYNLYNLIEIANNYEIIPPKDDTEVKEESIDEPNQESETSNVAI